MRVELFALCDFAADYAGKLSVIGIFDTMWTTQSPAVLPHCSVAVKFRFEKIEEGQKRLRLSVADMDGHPVIPAIDMPITVTFAPEVHSGTIQVVVNIGGLKLEKLGEYSVDLAVDGRHEGSIPLYVRQRAQAQS